MARYTYSIAGVALSTSADVGTIVTAATGAGSVVDLHEIWLAGEAGSSSFARVVVNRPGSVGVTPTTQTLNKLKPSSPNPTFTVASSFATPPVLSAQHVLVPAFNAFAGVIKWTAMPGGQVTVGGQGAIANLSVRSASGTPTVSGHFIMEEV